MNRDSYDARTPSSTHPRHPHPARSQSTIPSSSVQQHPHQPGTIECRCPACHLKNELFPRTQDGKIMLPSPWTASTPSAQPQVAMPRPISTSSRPPRVALATEAGVHDIQRPQSSAAWHSVPEERGETASRGRSTHIGRGHTGTMPMGPTSTSPSTNSPRASSDVHQSRRARSRASHPYDPNAKKKNDSGSTTIAISGPSNQLRPWQNLSEETADISRRSPRLTSYPPGSAGPSESRMNFQGHPYMVENTPQALSSTVTGARGDHQINMSGSFSMLSMGPTGPSNERAAHHRHRNAHSQSSISYRTEPDFADSTPTDNIPNTSAATTYYEQPTRVIRFSSRTHNPEPVIAGVGGSSTAQAEQAGPSNSQLPPQQVQTQATRIRFQDPVVPESSTGSTSIAGDGSVVQVKWDSDRKRRQGYFAQEEGSEKSPFRHYNKADCDFDN